MGDLGGLLLALGNSDVRIRGPAERAELEARTGNFPGYLLALVTHLADETQSPVTRQQALLLLKNSVALDARNQEKKAELAARWMAVDTTIRDHIKGALLSTLAASASEVRYIAASVIANLARVELPLNLWGDLLPGLMGTCQRDNDGLMEAALTTLGYICEETNSSDSLREVMQHHSPALLTAICTGMSRPSPSVRYFATNALVNSLEFVHGSMTVEAGRDILLRAICDATAAAEERTREKAMECLVKVASLYYEYLPKYILEILAVTTRALEHDGEKVAMQALQFWCAICGVESDEDDETPKANYAEMAVNSLVPHLLRCLTKQEAGQTEEDWNLSNAASKTLINLAETVANKILDLVMPFVFQHIASEDWHYREAALMAFGCVISGAEPETVQNLVAQATTGILAYLTDKNPQVADTAAWVLAVMCEDYLDIFTARPEATKTWFDAVVPLFRGSLRPALRAAQIVHNVALQLEEEQDEAKGESPSNELSPYFGHLLQMLQHNVDRAGEEGGRLRMETQEAMNALIGAAAKDCYPMLGLLVDEIIKRLGATTVAVQQHQMSAAEGQSYIGLLCGGLMQVTRKVGVGIKVSDRQRQIMEAMVHVVGTSDTGVQMEALQTIGVVANTLKAEFLQYLPHVLPAIIKGLETTADEDLCIASIGTVSDLASGLKETFGAAGGPCQQIMTIFVNHLRNPDVSEDIKCTVIQCTGDVALHTGPLFEPYLQVVLATFGDMDAIIQHLDLKDPDNEEAALNFCEAICIGFAGILQGFKGTLAPLYPYIPAIIAFTIRTAKTFHAPVHDDVFRVAVSLIGDLANVISNDAPPVIAHYKPQLCTAEVDKLVQLAESRTGKGYETTLENGKFARAELRVLFSA